MFTANIDNTFNAQRVCNFKFTMFITVQNKYIMIIEEESSMKPPIYSSYNQTCYFLFLIESARLHNDQYHSNELVGQGQVKDRNVYHLSVEVTNCIVQ